MNDTPLFEQAVPDGGRISEPHISTRVQEAEDTPVQTTVETISGAMSEDVSNASGAYHKCACTDHCV